MGRLLAMLTLCTGLVVMTGCESRDSASDAMAQLDDVDAQVNVEGFEYQRLPNGDRVLSGRLVNPTSRHVQNAQVQVSLYDEYNQAVGNVMILVTDIGADSEQSFRHTLDRDDISGARVRAILAR